MARAFCQGQEFHYWKEMKSHYKFVGDASFHLDRQITDPKYEKSSNIRVWHQP